MGKEGEEVFGFLQYNGSQTQGAFSEYITVRQDECALKPKGVDFDLAAASTTEPVTALQALRDKGGLCIETDKQQTVWLWAQQVALEVLLYKLPRICLGHMLQQFAAQRMLSKLGHVWGASCD